MVASITLAGLTLRSGLRLRSARLRQVRRPSGERERHLRLAKPTIVMVCIGFFAGLVTAYTLRGWGIFTTAHSLVSSTALLLFLVTGYLGRALETGRSRRVDLHAAFALASVGMAVASFFTGFVLLP